MIREATPNDRELLANIIRKAFADVARRFSLTAHNCPKHPSNCTPSWIEADFLRGVQYFILSKNNNPIGCVGIERPSDDVCYLERLSVIPEMRGNHFGRALVQHALNYAASKGAIKVGIGIIAEQIELKQWYEKLGFIEKQTKSFPHLPFEVCLMEKEERKEKDQRISRRTFLAAAGGTIVSIGLPGVFIKLSDAGQHALAANTRPDGRPRIPPGQQAIEKIQDMGGTPGTATIADWNLRVNGELEKPTDISYEKLLDLEQVHITCDVHCVTGWTLLDSRWSGVRLATIMDLIKPRKNAAFIIFEAAGGYTSSVPISDTLKENVILAHSFFGEKLQRPFGAPIRVIIPDRYFYKSVKWIEALKVTSQDEPGYWESRGYSNSADPWTEDRFK